MAVGVVCVVDPGGSASREIAELFWWMVVLAVVVVGIVGTGLAVGVRRRGAGDHRVSSSTAARGDARLEADAEADAERVASRRWIVWGGVVLPAAVIATVFAVTLGSMRAVSEDRDADLTIEITGHRWWWEVAYPARS